MGAPANLQKTLDLIPLVEQRRIQRLLKSSLKSNRRTQIFVSVSNLWEYIVDLCYHILVNMFEKRFNSYEFKLISDKYLLRNGLTSSHISDIMLLRIFVGNLPSLFLTQSSQVFID